MDTNVECLVTARCRGRGRYMYIFQRSSLVKRVKRTKKSVVQINVQLRNGTINFNLVYKCSFIFYKSCV